MVTASGLVFRLVNHSSAVGALVVLSMILLVATACAFAVVIGGLLAPAPAPIQLAPLRW